MGLFDKKNCSICGEKIGLLGNRKLEDGNLCKSCAAKLSPWFDERRHSTVEDIRGQLEYREANLERVKEFQTTSTFGQSTLLYLDENKQQFMVAKTRNLTSENPDVLNFSDVTGCDLDIEENKTEEKREVKGANGTTNRVSYVPPRYTYEYNFWIRIRVNNPYFGEIRFRLNRSSISYDPRQMGGGISSAGAGIARIMGAYNPGMQQNGTDPRMMIPDYAECVKMGEEIKKALSDIHTQVRDDIAAANQPKIAVQCPYCGATTTPDASGRCEYCGGAIS